MAKDPVCGLSVDESRAAGAVTCDGRTYHFCSAHGKGQFKKARSVREKATRG